MGRDVCQIEIGCGQPIVAVRVFGQLLTSRGPIWDGEPSPSAKTDAFCGTGLRLVNAENMDTDALAAANFRQLATAASVAELDLRGDAALRLAATQGKWRNRWRHAQAAPVTLRQERFDPAAHQWLLDADSSQQRQKRFRGLPHALILALAAQQAVDVHVAYLDATPLAAMLFIKHRPVVTYHLGWISTEGRQWGLHHRILINAAAAFANQDYVRMYLGTVDTDNAPGLARFKIGSGARIRSLGGSWLRFGLMRG